MRIIAWSPNSYEFSEMITEVKVIISIETKHNFGILLNYNNRQILFLLASFFDVLKPIQASDGKM